MRVESGTVTGADEFPAGVIVTESAAGLTVATPPAAAIDWNEFVAAGVVPVEPSANADAAQPAAASVAAAVARVARPLKLSKINPSYSAW